MNTRTETKTRTVYKVWMQIEAQYPDEPTREPENVTEPDDVGLFPTFEEANLALRAMLKTGFEHVLEMDNVFEMTDQPETCRRCGARTEFVDLDDGAQLHTCEPCGFRYRLEPPDQDDELAEPVRKIVHGVCRAWTRGSCHERLTMNDLTCIRRSIETTRLQTRALQVLTRDDRIREWLAEHDPKALEQAEQALAPEAP